MQSLDCFSGLIHAACLCANRDVGFGGNASASLLLCAGALPPSLDPTKHIRQPRRTQTTVPARSGRSRADTVRDYIRTERGGAGCEVSKLRTETQENPEISWIYVEMIEVVKIYGFPKS